jgi:hypothetical protein
MSTQQTQISALISGTTKTLLEDYSEAHGVATGDLVEQALLFHLRALQELPADLIIPPRVIVQGESGQEILERLSSPRRPTAAMQALFTK